MSLILPTDVDGLRASRALGRAAIWLSVVFLVATFVLVVALGLDMAQADVALALLALGLAGLSVAWALRASNPWAVFALTLLTGVAIFVFTLTISADVNSLWRSDAALFTMPKMAITIVGVAGRSLPASIARSTVGFVVGSVAVQLATRITGVTFAFDPPSIVSWIVIVLLLSALWYGRSRSKRGVAAMQAAAEVEERDSDQNSAAAKASASLHGTLLADLHDLSVAPAGALGEAQKASLASDIALLAHPGLLIDEFVPSDPDTVSSKATGLTAQQIDPLGGVTARIFLAAVGLFAVVIATVLALTSRQQADAPTMVAAIVVLAGGFAFLVWAADPFRRQVTQVRYDIAFGLVLLAFLLEHLAEVGRNTAFRDDWGPVVVGLVLMVAGAYRRPSQIVLRTIVATVVVAVFTIATTGMTEPAELVVAVTLTCSLVVGLGGGASIYARSLISGLQIDRAEAAEARRRRAVRDRRLALEQFVGEDVEPLRREVLPYLRTVKARGAMTEGDRDRAAVLLRAVHDSFTSRVAAEPLEGLVTVYRDPDGLAPMLVDQQRSALRALLIHAAAHSHAEVDGLGLSFSRVAGEDLHVGAVSTVPTPRGGSDTGRAPFLGMMHLAFERVDVESTGQAVTIRFWFRE